MPKNATPVKGRASHNGGKPLETSGKPAAVTAPRKIKERRYRSFHLDRRIKKRPPQPTLASPFRLLRDAAALMLRQWRVCLGILLIYGLSTTLLVQSFGAGGDVAGVKSVLQSAFNGQLGQFVSSVSVFAYLLGSSGNVTSPTAGAYQLMLTLITSLALIWTFRQAYASQKIRIRDTYYRGMYPLIPFVLVLVLAALQLLPFAIGAILYGMVTGNGIAVTMIEQILWAVVLGLSGLVSVYMLSSSIFGLYVVCLPDMTPFKALRASRDLVRYRRWAVVGRVLFLPFSLLLAGFIIMLPVIYFAAPAASLVFALLSMVGLAMVHGYLYRLYRELIA